MPDDVTGSSPEGVQQGSPPADVQGSSPENAFGSTTEGQTVPIARLQTVLAQKKGVESELSALKQRLEVFESGPNPASSPAPPGTTDMDQQIQAWQDKASSAFRDQDDTGFIAANNAMMQLHTQKIVNDTLHDVAKQHEVAQQQENFRSQQKSYMDQLKQQYPDFSDQGSELFKAASQIYSGDPNFATSARGMYDAGIQAVLRAQSGGPDMGSASLLSGSTPSGSSVPDNPLASLRGNVGDSDGLQDFLAAMNDAGGFKHKDAK